MLEVRLFAILRERAGTDRVELDLPDGATVADAFEALATRPGIGEVLAAMPVQAAVNREYAERDAVLAPGDELALVPPVSGGAEIAARVTEEPLSLERIAESVIRPGAGALVTFSGVTREVARLDYEAYAEMAEEKIAAILGELMDAHGLEAAVAEHRVGPVPRGEASVVVAVAAAHRAEAFAGAREAIDRIKAEAPIWKQEVELTESGAERAQWVDGTPPAGESR